MKTKTFWYHSTGSNNNGNDGPDENTPGWVKIVALTYEEAVTKLPASEQAKVNAELKKERCKSFDEFWYCTAGMGNGFTLRCEEHGEMSDMRSLPTSFTAVN